MFWVTYGLPGIIMNDFSTYEIIDKDKLPEITINPKYEKYKDLHVLSEDPPFIQSPTACKIKINLTEKSFYHDQQDCVIWYFDPEIGVYIDENPNIVVSKSLEEFLSRIDLESRVWYGKTGPEESKYIDGCAEKNS